MTMHDELGDIRATGVAEYTLGASGDVSNTGMPASARPNEIRRVKSSVAVAPRSPRASIDGAAGAWRLQRAVQREGLRPRLVQRRVFRGRVQRRLRSTALGSGGRAARRDEAPWQARAVDVAAPAAARLT
ncbi:hypothetical protein [Streptomyces sp. bgisy154]|uniref:hypothetical protein n=1 Tax=Streptomyces sp. bgisy154 TaxID=3413794 RepID=UPI003D754C91